MAAEKAEDVAIPAAAPRGRYINKRALKNKAVAVTFNEKGLRYYPHSLNLNHEICFLYDFGELGFIRLVLDFWVLGL